MERMEIGGRETGEIRGINLFFLSSISSVSLPPLTYPLFAAKNLPSLSK
jgi:hypothetical protein